MTLGYRIFPDRGVVYVRHDTRIDLAGSGAMFAAYTRDPDFRPAQKQLIDFTHATALDTRFVDMMALQARTTDIIAPAVETRLAFHAPTPVTGRLALSGFNAWTDVPGVIARIVATPRAVEDFLGLPEDSLATLLDAATP